MQREIENGAIEAGTKGEEGSHWHTNCDGSPAQDTIPMVRCEWEWC